MKRLKATVPFAKDFRRECLSKTPTSLFDHPPGNRLGHAVSKRNESGLAELSNSFQAEIQSREDSPEDHYTLAGEENSSRGS